MKKVNSRFLLFLKRILLVLLPLYLLICVMLFFFQDRLIFSLAYNHSQENSASFHESDNNKILKITTSDGCILQGYWLHAGASRPTNLLFYFGANAEDVSLLTDKMDAFTDWSIVLMPYRGYGKSEGTPSAEKLYQDSQEIYDYVLAASDTEYQSIVIMGRSIGSSVATYLASTRENAGVILISPFDSLTHVITQKCPIVPVNFLLKHKFESINYAPYVTSPVYILAGSKDWLVPTSLTHKLADHFDGKVTYEEIPGASHNSIDDCDEYWVLIQKNLTDLQP